MQGLVAQAFFLPRCHVNSVDNISTFFVQGGLGKEIGGEGVGPSGLLLAKVSCELCG